MTEAVTILTRLGFTPNQSAILAALATTGRPATSAEFTATRGISRQSVYAAMGELVELGIVVKAPRAGMTGAAWSTDWERVTAGLVRVLNERRDAYLDDVVALSRAVGVSDPARRNGLEGLA